jgi:hypothetical protein
MVLIVFFLDECLVLKHQPFNLSQRVGGQAAIPGQRHGIKPELAFSIGSPNVNVRWFASLIRVKMEPKWTDSQYRGACRNRSIRGRRAKQSILTG